MNGRRWSRAFTLFVAVLLAAGVSGLWCLKNLGQSQRWVAGQPALRGQLDSIARLAGFGIDMVVLTGHRFTADDAIFDALDLPNARSLFSFDTEGVRRRLERLPWVQSADVTRVFPGRLDVRVRERRAFAVWVRGSQVQVIDETGRVLSDINRGDGLSLPRVAGEGAASESKAILTQLARFPDLLSRLEQAERVGGRRWTLHLTRGVTVHLPADREAAALEVLNAGGRVARLLQTDNRIIDLRAPGRTAYRPAGTGIAPGSLLPQSAVQSSDKG